MNKIIEERIKSLWQEFVEMVEGQGMEIPPDDTPDGILVRNALIFGFLEGRGKVCCSITSFLCLKK